MACHVQERGGTRFKTRPHTLPAPDRAGFGITLSCWQRRELGEESRPDALEERRIHTPDGRRSDRPPQFPEQRRARVLRVVASVFAAITNQERDKVRKTAARELSLRLFEPIDQRLREDIRLRDDNQLGWRPGAAAPTPAMRAIA